MHLFRKTRKQMLIITNFMNDMDYEKFIFSISKVKDFPLPGIVSQILAVPFDRKKEINIEKVHKKAKIAAVLIFCYPKKGKMHLSLIKRAVYNGVHSGQISFPGGKYESNDNTLENTAIRECNEELGVEINLGSILTGLTPVYIPPSNFYVKPFLAYSEFHPNFQINTREVEYHIELPLFKLLELKIKKKKLKDIAHRGKLVPCFTYKNHLIWGATAMILSEFKVFLGNLSSN